MLTTPMRVLVIAIARWLNEEQRQKIEFLQEEVRLLQELHRGTSEKGHYVATEDGERCEQFGRLLGYYRQKTA